MKPVAKKLSSVILSAAMIVSLTPFPGGLLMADETEPAAPATTVGETEHEKKNEPEKPASEKPQEPEKPAAEAPKETKETEAPAEKETEKPEAEAPKETENNETEAPKETEKHAETEPEETNETEAEQPAVTVPEESKPSEEAPKETESSETEAPKENEEPSETVPQESEKPETEVPEKPAGSDSNEAKDAPIVEANITNVTFEDGILKWDAVSGATQYIVTIDSNFDYTVNTTSFKLGETIDNLIKTGKLYAYSYYDIQIVAYDKNGMYLADWCDDIRYNSSATFQEGTIANTKITNGILTWKAYSGALFYNIQIWDGNFNPYGINVEKLSYNLNNWIDELIKFEYFQKSSSGLYDVRITAYGSNWKELATTLLSHKYDSQAAPLEYGTIANPKITNGILTWDAYQGASSYYVELASAWGKYTDASSMEIGKAIDDLIASGVYSKTGKYRVGITAYDTKDRVIASYSGKLAYESSATELSEGTITGASITTDGILKWDAYSGTEKYWIKISEEDYSWVITKNNSINLNQEIDKLIKSREMEKSKSGNYTIEIFAKNTYGSQLAYCQLTHYYESKATEIVWERISGVTFDTDGTMSWNACNGAVKYTVDVEGIITETTSTTFATKSTIDSLVKAGKIQKSNPYGIDIRAYDSDGQLVASWNGEYYYLTSSAGVSYDMGSLSLVKFNNGIVSWNKYKGAVKYKISTDPDIELTTTAANSVNINELIYKKINSGETKKYRYYDIDIYALDKNGLVIAWWSGDYKLIEPNSLDVTGKTIKAKRKKKKTFSVAKAITFKNRGQGKLTYAKVSGNKKISINKTTGKITVKKGLKKKTYKVAIRVTASGRTVYAATQRTVTVKVKVK